MARKKPLCAFLALCLSAADKRLTARSRKEKGGPPDVKKYTLKRILTSLFTLLAILLVLFILMQLMPGSPFNDEKLTPDMRAALYAKYGLDQPIYIQFFRYVGNMLRGDLGVSYNISKIRPSPSSSSPVCPSPFRWAAWRSRWVPSQVWCWAFLPL